jgi:cytochrome c5
MNAYRLAVPLFMAIALIGCSKGGGGGGENAAANAAAPAAAENAPASNMAAPAENAPAAGNMATPSGAAENAAAPAENAAAPAENTGAAAGAPGAENSAAAAGGASASAADGQQVFQTTCSACHGTGVMGAPKFGNKGDWAPRIAKGKATLYDHALHGFKQMPAKGGNPSLSDAQVKAAVDYMVAQASK